MVQAIQIKNRFLGAHCSTEGGVATAPHIGNQIGCTAIQLFTTSNRQWKQRILLSSDVDAFHKRMESGTIKIAFSHAMYLINLASPESDVFRHSIAVMTQEIKRASLLGLPFVIVHPGSHKGKGRDWGIYRIAEAISKIFDKSLDIDVKIALETTAGQGRQIGSTFEELAMIMDVVNVSTRLGVCFDTCHVFSSGYDIKSRKGYNDTWKKFDDTIGFDKLLAIHINDSKGELGKRIDRHEHIGKGKIGLKGFSNLMNDPRLVSVPMVLETPKEENALKNDSMNLRRLLKLI